MAAHLPEVQVGCLRDVELLPTRGGPPHHLVFVGATSLSEARAILTVLREKGVLRRPEGDLYPAEGDFFAAVDEDEDDHTAAAAAEERVDVSWAAGLKEAKDTSFSLDDSDIDSDSDNEGGAANGVGAHDDQVAAGWVLDDAHTFFRAVELGMLLEEVAGGIVPKLHRRRDDPTADKTVLLRRLRTRGRAIRRLGKQLPWLMGQAPVTLGNFLQNVAAKHLSCAAWTKSRSDTVLARVVDLYNRRKVLPAA